MSEYHKIAKKVSAFNDYVSSVSNRDRVMSVVQFIALALYEPAEKAGCPKLSHDFKAILGLVAQYRAITRFSQWFVVMPLLTPQGIAHSLKTYPTKLTAILKTLSTAFFTVFLIGEDINLFSKANVVSPLLASKWNRARYVFLFWSNIMRTTMNFLLLRCSKFERLKDGKDHSRANEQKRLELNVWDGVLQSMFAYCLLRNSVPCGPSCFLEMYKAGDLLGIIASFAPPVRLVHPTAHGILGIVAAIPGIRVSLLH